MSTTSLWHLSVITAVFCADQYANSENPHSNVTEKVASKIYFSLLQSGIMDLLKQSFAPNYTPQNPSDFFDFLRNTYDLPPGNNQPLQLYDYVIVGAGSAGSALASRLSEDKESTVLLIEAGSPESIITDIPLIAPFFQRTGYTWPYVMEHQSGVCMGMENERCFWPRGRAVGGSSVINYMIYTRGRPQDWDRIAADGNYGWTYNDVLMYFIKSEKCKLDKYKNLPHRGRDGKLSVENVPFRTRLSQAFLQAGKYYGNKVVDYNAPDGFGFGLVQATTSGGRRHSAARAYLYPHRKRDNLHILPNTVATKILINHETKRAYGVEYVRNRLTYKVEARREVILSAGPIASPQLLMLSGIGPAKHLRSLNIPVIQDLKVGRTLYDHITFPGLIFKLNTTSISILEHKVNLAEILKWKLYGRGMLSSIGGVEGIGYIKTEVSNDPELVPDIELINLGTSMAGDLGPGGSEAIRKGARVTDHTFYNAFGDLAQKDTWSIIPMLLHPKSKGYLELRNTNPFSHPKLYGNYLTVRQDVDTFIAAIRYIIKLGKTPALQKFGATLHEAKYPTCVQYWYDTDDYWECAVRTLTATLHHQIGTCKMGPHSDPDAVVDPELRVYGIQGLRVVDTSIIPRTTSAHTNAPGMMIGEKAADMIKRSWSE